MSNQTQPEAGPEIEVERNVAVPMRDGTVLRADVYRPAHEGPHPALVERVAYELTDRCRAEGEYFAGNGYVFVGQHVRGCFASEGRRALFRDDGWGANQDGYDTIEWIAAQPWCTGRVAMFGGSYSGCTQYLAAPTAPPHLRALHVREGGSDHYVDHCYRGGAFQLGLMLGWHLHQQLAWLQHETAPAGMDAARLRLEKAVEQGDRWMRHLPLCSCPPLEGVADDYFEIFEHPEDGPYWWPLTTSLKYGEVDVPILHQGGWFDVLLASTLRCFQGIRARGRTPHCRDNQRLIIGPWIHGPGGVGQRQVGELDFGPEAEFDLDAHRLLWYDHWLMGTDNEVAQWPPVHVFLMGANRWLDLQEWPPPGIDYTPLYFRQGTEGPGASLNDGSLSWEPPPATETADSFAYDPDDPVPSQIRYPELGPTDHRSAEARMLTYTSPVLENDLTVMGPVRAVLYGLSSALDTDWVVRLCDVWPDGRSLSVCDGILRARYRSSMEHTELMTPDQVYCFDVDLWSTAQVFQAGHRLRVQVTSSDFPRYDRNLNTGGPIGKEVRGQVADNTVFHDALRPSHLVLPLVDTPA